jgi:hypothetical protein
MVYALEDQSPRELAERVDGAPAVDVALFLDGEEAVARRDGTELRFAPEDAGGWIVSGDRGVLDPEDYPNGFERVWCALRCPNAGEVIVSAKNGWEFVDLGGRHHAGGGSHGSLLAGDSTVPMLAAGLEGAALPEEASVTDLAPLVLAHFGVEPPPSMRARVSAGV